jgi:hypothetical protein
VWMQGFIRSSGGESGGIVIHVYIKQFERVALYLQVRYTMVCPKLYPIRAGRHAGLRHRFHEQSATSLVLKLC